MHAQGKASKSSEFFQLPNCNNEIALLLNSKQINTLKDLTQYTPSAIERILAQYAGQMKSGFLAAVSNLSIFNLKVRIVAGVLEYDVKDNGELRLADGSFSIEVAVQRSRGDSAARVYAPKYHKAKVASYWLLISMNGQLLVSRRFDGIRKSAFLNAVVDPSTLRPTDKKFELKVKLVSDSVIGIGAELRTSVVFG